MKGITGYCPNNKLERDLIYFPSRYSNFALKMAINGAPLSIELPIKKEQVVQHFTEINPNAVDYIDLGNSSLDW